MVCEGNLKCAVLLKCRVTSLRNLKSKYIRMYLKKVYELFN